MRGLLLVIGLTVFAGSGRAQEQDRKLADRLLRPDMTLVNPAQDLKFAGICIMPVDKKQVVKSFQITDARITRTFAAGKDFFTKGFETRKFTWVDWSANAGTHPKMASANVNIVTRKSSLTRATSDEGQWAETRDYADSRPFLAEGTRQKALSQEDKPLTIDEVRELLNKSR